MEADYSIRVLQSRKKLIAAAPVKDPQTGNMRTKVFTVEARAAFIEATTASSRQPRERDALLRAGDGREPRADAADPRAPALDAHRARPRAARRRPRRSRRRHWNAQRLLEPLPVVIPFADRLSFPVELDADAARPRPLPEPDRGLGLPPPAPAGEEQGARSWPLSRTTRPPTRSPAEVLRETLTDVKKPLREAYQRIRELWQRRAGAVSRREIREALGVPDSTVRRWLAELVDLEYLAMADGRARAARARPRATALLDREPQESEVARPSLARTSSSACASRT